MSTNSLSEIPSDLRTRLESARLDLLALFRALDQMDLTPSEIPQRLIHQLFELDADCAEALWALEQPPRQLNVSALLRDTLAALEQIPSAVELFKKNLPKRAHKKALSLQTTIRKQLDPQEAYNEISGHIPQNR